MATEELIGKVGFGCYINAEILMEVDARAKEEQRSRNVMIERLVKAALDAKIPT